MASDGASTSRHHPNTSTPLLSDSGDISNWPMFADGLASEFGSRSRPLTTPLDTIVPEETWWQSLWSNCCMSLENVRELCSGPWPGFFDGKLAAVLCCFSLPCCVLGRATGEHKNPMINFRHSGIVYLYIIMCCTIVFNLVELKIIEKPGRNVEPPVQQVRQYFVIFCMVVAIVAMLYLFCRTYRQRVPSEHRDGPLRIYFQGGLYLFGFVSMGYAVCLAINDFTCKRSSIPGGVQTMKTLYIVFQTLFLNFFYEARIPEEILFVQFVLAHLLGTNFALWFWTTCTESNEVNSTLYYQLTNCTDYPITLDGSQKYFYPLFVEYLILAASIIYEVWKNLLPVETSQQQRPPLMMENPRALSLRQRYIPSCGFGMVFGACFAAIFVVLILASVDNGPRHHVYFFAYSVGTLVLYLSQIIVCYIVQISLQSQRRKRQNLSALDHDDFLLYISLGGILLWEGFHVFSLLLKGHPQIAMTIVVDSVGCVQHLSQAVTLINMRRYRNARNKNSAWLCECVLFMLVTNLGLWIQNSFFLEAIIDRPGENHADLKEELVTFGYLLRPLAIFFRFHSATCFYHAWTIFKAWA